MKSILSSACHFIRHLFRASVAALLLAAAPWLQANDILSSQPIMLASADPSR